MNTVHTYLLSKEDPIQKLLNGQQALQNHTNNQQLFNISVALYQDNREFVIGNSQLPLEDLCDLVKDYEEKTGQYTKHEQRATLRRVLFLYGTSYSQRENCIIGKVAVEISYSALKQFLSSKEIRQLEEEGEPNVVDPSTTCFMHRETYINRKIPLNALLSIYVDRVTNLKESIENIEHFAKIHHSSYEGQQIQEPKEEQVDRRKILTQVLKNGLNLVVISSVFDEDENLRDKFASSKQKTRLLYNSLNPVYGEIYQLPLQMDTKIFDYLKTKRAVFEVRHYIVPSDQKNSSLSYAPYNLRNSRQNLQDDSSTMERCNYITLGYVRVPLLHLITKNNGIDGDFVILDDYKQKMGALKLRISLNHHNTQRPLFAGSTRLPTQLPQSASAPSNTGDHDLRRATLIDRSIVHDTVSRNSQDGEFIIALNFVELIMSNRPDIAYQIKKACGDCPNTKRSSLLYIKFRFLGINYQTKFLALASDNTESIQSHFMKKVEMLCLDIHKTILLKIDFSNQTQIEQAFACPLEVQLWHKVTNKEIYHAPESEELIGSFFLELNELPKTQNMRVKASNDNFTCFEGYLSMHDFKKEKVGRERLGVKIMMIRNNEPQMAKDIERAFNWPQVQEVEFQIQQRLDPQSRGYCELDDLTSLIEDHTGDCKVVNTLLRMVGNHLEYKNIDSVFYSPLLCLPPPYFKHANAFDSFDIIHKFYQELAALDSHEVGFVPLAIFRSVLECELKIKVKIVDDFVANCRQPQKTVDVNATSNSFHAHLDYIVLIRKLIQYIETKETARKNILVSAAPMVDQAPRPEPQGESVTLTVSIDNAMRLRNPLNELEAPNSFVQMRAPFDGCYPEDGHKTITVNQSCYPSWNSKDIKLRIPLTKLNEKRIVDGVHNLQFEVYHAEHQDSSSKIYSSPKLIGTAFVDISPLFLKTSHQISGYFHLVNKMDLNSSQQIASLEPTEMAKKSLGQIKVSVTADNSPDALLRASTEVLRMGGQETVAEVSNPFEHDDLARNFDTFGKSSDLMNQLSVAMEESETTHEDVLLKHTQNMDELEALTQKLKQTLNGMPRSPISSGTSKIPLTTASSTLRTLRAPAQMVKDMERAQAARPQEAVKVNFPVHQQDEVMAPHTSFEERNESSRSDKMSQRSDKKSSSSHGSAPDFGRSEVQPIAQDKVEEKRVNFKQRVREEPAEQEQKIGCTKVAEEKPMLAQALVERKCVVPCGEAEAEFYTERFGTASDVKAAEASVDKEVQAAADLQRELLRKRADRVGIQEERERREMAYKLGLEEKKSHADELLEKLNEKAASRAAGVYDEYLTADKKFKGKANYKEGVPREPTEVEKLIQHGQKSLKLDQKKIDQKRQEMWGDQDDEHIPNLPASNAENRVQELREVAKYGEVVYKAPSVLERYQQHPSLEEVETEPLIVVPKPGTPDESEAEVQAVDKMESSLSQKSASSHHSLPKEGNFGYQSAKMYESPPEQQILKAVSHEEEFKTTEFKQPVETIQEVLANVQEVESQVEMVSEASAAISTNEPKRSPPRIHGEYTICSPSRTSITRVVSPPRRTICVPCRRVSPVRRCSPCRTACHQTVVVHHPMVECAELVVDQAPAHMHIGDTAVLQHRRPATHQFKVVDQHDSLSDNAWPKKGIEVHATQEADMDFGKSIKTDSAQANLEAQLTDVRKDATLSRGSDKNVFNPFLNQVIPEADKEDSGNELDRE